MSGLRECPACDGDGFVRDVCGCREAACPHEPFFGRADDPRPGSYLKFWVRRTDGGSREGEKHEECDYFVLDLSHDKFAKPALLAYAAACEGEKPELAADLRREVEEMG